MNLEELMLTDEELTPKLMNCCNCYGDGEAVARAAAAKALWGVAQWLQENNYGDRDWNPGLAGADLMQFLTSAEIPCPKEHHD